MAGREPFSRHRSGHHRDERWPGEHLAAAYEFAAAEYHWKPGEVEGELTDEQFVLLLDSAQDRMAERAQARFDTLVEAVRVGTVIAQDRKALAKWNARRRPDRRSRGLTGQALEEAVMTLATMNPEYVVVGP